MKIDYLDIKQIKPYERNAKKHDKKQINNVAESIKQFGFVQPIVIDNDYNIIIGHCRFEASKKLKMKKVPCYFAENLDDEQIAKLRLLDNKLNESDWDFELLAEDIPELDFSGFDVEWNIPETEIEEEGEIDEDEIPEKVETRVKTGDLWKLGNHFLICGDSTDPVVIDRLMDGKKADLIFTDPPYNVAMSRSKVDGSNNSIMNDDLNEEDFIELLQGAFNNAIMNCKTKNMYWWIGFRAYSTLEKIFNDAGIKISNCIVWDKGSIGLGGNGYRYQHELCIFSGEINNNSASDVWQFKRATSGLYPTMKPLKLIAHAIRNIKDVKIVLDLFGGSGSTLIACEKLNRVCYMCELDEHYCDVIIERWENETGEKAILMNGE